MGQHDFWNVAPRHRCIQSICREVPFCEALYQECTEPTKLILSAEHNTQRLAKTEQKSYLPTVLSANGFEPKWLQNTVALFYVCMFENYELTCSEAC